MGGPGSGGSNRRSIEWHKLRGTFRPSRHGRELTVLPAWARADAAEMARRLDLLARGFLTTAARGGKASGKALSLGLKALQAARAFLRYAGDDDGAGPAVRRQRKF